MDYIGGKGVTQSNIRGRTRLSGETGVVPDRWVSMLRKFGGFHGDGAIAKTVSGCGDDAG